MKRAFAAFLAAGAVASLLWAQAPAQVILRLPSGDRNVAAIQQSGQTYVSAAEMMSALGGSFVAEQRGYRVSLHGYEAAFGPDSRFAVVRADLIEMPVVPVIVETRPFVPWQFFEKFLQLSSQQALQWESTAKILTVRPASRESVTAQVSVVAFEDTSKMVIQLSAPSDYNIAREGDSYFVRFRNPLGNHAADQAYEGPHIARVVFGTDQIEVQLSAPDIVAASYRLDQPFRVVLDFKKGLPPAEPNAPLPPSRKPIDLPGIRTIVLDPGHGGKEVGAIGPNGLLEKETTLAICQKLSGQLSRKLNARVILTRTDDTVVSLDQRTAMANQYKADLFLSVHLNASLIKGARGSETYFLSLEASDEQARSAAERENLPATPSGVSEPSSDLRLILWDLAQQENLKESSRFAELVQEEMNGATEIQNRGVKQAPFKVLVGATMPAALVEVGFISNPEEEQRLRGAGFQDSIVAALLQAIERYKHEYEARIGMTAAAPASTSKTSLPVTTPPPAAPDRGAQ